MLTRSGSAPRKSDWLPPFYRYHIEPFNGSVICAVCNRHAAEPFRQVEDRLYVEGWTFSGEALGHKTCLYAIRR